MKSGRNGDELKARNGVEGLGGVGPRAAGLSGAGREGAGWGAERVSVCKKSLGIGKSGLSPKPVHQAAKRPRITLSYNRILRC